MCSIGACSLTVMLLATWPRIAVWAQAPVSSFDAAIANAQSMPRLHSLLISHRGDIMLERYFNGTAANDIANVKSVSKSLISALVGIAIERGYIQSVREPIAQYFDEAEWAGTSAADTTITIEDLLTMQAGLETTSNRNYGAWVLSPNWIDFALSQPVTGDPGTRMQYSTGNTHLLSAILTRATKMSTLDFARSHLSEPLGFRLASWPQDPQGIYFGGNDMELTPRQMLTVGDLYLNNGLSNGRQVVPAQWIAASLQRRTESPREEGRYYGYGWWIRDMAGHEAPYAWGYGGQFILLVPSLQLVVVTTSSSNPGPDRRSHTRRMYDLVEHDIIAPLSRVLTSGN
jgi:CubicO group peptidase (beta-lactamase class C family)